MYGSSPMRKEESKPYVHLEIPLHTVQQCVSTNPLNASRTLVHT